MNVDVFILGAGAGGIGCTYSLIKKGFKVAVCDKFSDFGGTSVFCGVSCWEPGVTICGIHELLSSELEKSGAHAAKSVPNCNLYFPENGENWANSDFERYPWGLSVMDEKADYTDTLRRYGCDYARETKRFQFDEGDMTRAVRNIFSSYSENLITFFNTSVVSVNTSDNKVDSVQLSDGTVVNAKYFVDAGGSIPLARMCGCKYTTGTEGKDTYNEPSATLASDEINGVTYVFRIRKVPDADYIDEIPLEYRTNRSIDIKTVSCFNTYPNGDINVNMLPTMSGKEYLELGDKANFEGHLRVWNYWNYLQTEKGMKGYQLIKIYEPGIREDYRLVGKKVLTENDIRQGLNSDDISRAVVAIADHALDIHGEGGLAKELSAPYAIPIECCMTNEFDNLFVSCRGASFSHIAASSARLTRTMLSMGEGVGEYLSMLLKDEPIDFVKINKKRNIEKFIKKI